MSFDSEAKRAMTTATHQNPQKEPSGSDDNGKLSLWQVICSVFAAGFGVQSKENKVRDFRLRGPFTTGR